MNPINYVLVADALLQAGHAADVARRYRSLRRRQQVIETAIARADSSEVEAFARRLNRLVLIRRHLEPLLREAAASLYPSRFSAVVSTHALREALYASANRDARSAVLSFNGRSLCLERILLPTIGGSGRGLAVLNRQHLRAACGLPGDAILIDVQLGFWGVMPLSGNPLLRFPHFRLTRRELQI